MTPRVSVVMSVYNGSRYLRESIDGILNQTFSDFEFVIIDDGSTDQTWEILTQYASQDSRIVLIQNLENIGLTKSLNKGLKAARGEYIARQDADDISLPERLKLQTHFLDTHSEVGAIGTAAKAIDQHGESLGLINVLPEHEDLVEHESLQAYLLVNNCLHHSSLMARRRLLEKLDGYNQALRYAQDYDLWWRLSQLSRIVRLPNISILVRQSTSNLSSTHRHEQLLCALKISRKVLSESLGGQSIDQEAYQKFWWAYLQVLDRDAYQKFCQAQPDRQMQLSLGDIQRLRPFWELLANHSLVWGPRLCHLAYTLLRQRQIIEGFQLLWIATRRLKAAFQWLPVIKSLVKPYLPDSTYRVWRFWQLQQRSNLR